MTTIKELEKELKELKEKQENDRKRSELVKEINELKESKTTKIFKGLGLGLYKTSEKIGNTIIDGSVNMGKAVLANMADSGKKQIDKEKDEVKSKHKSPRQIKRYEEPREEYMDFVMRI